MCVYLNNNKYLFLNKNNNKTNYVYNSLNFDFI